jgi:hypothetical protein
MATALALVIERWTEIWMNTVKARFGEPPPGQNSQQIIYRETALTIGVISGLILANMTLFDVSKVAFPGATIQSGFLITGIVMGRCSHS